MRLLPLLLFLAMLFASVAGPGGAQPAGGEAESQTAILERWDSEARRIEERLDEGGLEPREIDALRATLEAQRTRIPELMEAVRAELEPLRQQLGAIGAPPEEGGEEAPEVTAERQRLNKRIADAEARLKLLSQADARATALLSRLAELRREHFTRQLLTRGPSILEPGVAGRALDSLTSVVRGIVHETSARIGESRMDLPFALRVVLPLALIAAALLLLIGTRRAMVRRLTAAIGPETAPRHRVLAGIVATFVRLFVPVIALALVLFGIWISGFLGPEGRMLLRGLVRTALIVIGVYALAGAFYSPYAPDLRLSRLTEAEAATAHRWLIGVAAVVGLDRVFVVHGEELGLTIEALTLFNTLVLVLGGIAVWGYARHMHPPEHPGTAEEANDHEEDADAPPAESGVAILPLAVAAMRLIGRVVAITAPALAVMGYFAASRFLFYPVVYSGAVIGLCMLLFHVVKDAVDSFAEPAEGQAVQTPSRIRLIPVIVGFFLICAAVPVLALVWGADLTDLGNAWRAVSDGFSLGEVTISPLDFFWFLLVFGLGYVITGIVRGVLRRSVLPVTRLDAGGKAAISAGVFYVGVFLSALAAISATGADLSNLALVAGALSVGIGFGLQNIVNNFVSGLILLLERPIKSGDWVELASGMGYVKQINVRSTEIETFDRASLIVPNSELISSSVTNWTHTNMHGRLIVPVHVAYGSDPKKVEQVLLEIARAHSMLLRRPAPYVLFRRFGQDALDFEIRGILRDVNWILNVHSEINFEIARRFAEEDIRISYPQRDLHLRNADEVARSIRDVFDGNASAADDETRSSAPVPARRRERRSGRPGRDEGDADL